MNITRFSNFLIKFIYLSAALFLAVPNANATVYSLGDSLSDSGALGFTYTNPVALSPLFEGNVWVQYLTNSVPAFCNDPRHCKFDRDTFYYSGTGNNYAVGGAGVTFDSTDSRLAKNFTDLHSQIEALTHNHKLTREDVITVWMGANDIFAATVDPNTSATTVTQAAERFRIEIAKLARYGAKIYVITIPDLGQTPLGLSTSDGSQLLTELTNLFNSGISDLARVRNLTIIDSNVLFDDLRSSRDFDNSMIYCSVIIDPKHVCGNKKSNPEIINNSEVPFIFADPIHPSNAAHRWMGYAIQKLIH